MTNPRRCGWVQPEERHFKALRWAGPPAVLGEEPAPASSDNSALLPAEPYDQGDLGSCTANAVAQMALAAYAKAGRAPIAPSRMALYQWALIQAGRLGQDVGSQICTVTDCMADLGIPRERDWEYDRQLFAAQPGPAVARGAYDFRSTSSYHQLTGYGDAFIEQVERALGQGFVIPFGVQVTHEFVATVPLDTVHAPKVGDVLAGGHAMVLVGHDRANARALARNSWGLGWGDPSLPPGYYWIGYDYLRQASDLWIMQTEAVR